MTGTETPESATPDRDAVTGDAQSVAPSPVTVTDGPAAAASHTERDAGNEATLRRVAEAQGITVDELVDRLRDVENTHAADASLCPWCEGPMPADATTGQRYCSRNCSKEASRYRITRRREAAMAAAQRGLDRRGAATATAATEGNCDACGRPCHIENALCDACIDDLHVSARDAAGDASATRDREERERG